MAPTTPARADPIQLPELLDEELFCTELTPRALSFTTVPTRLDLRILLDGVPVKTARDAVAAMRTAYAPLDIEVRPTYRGVQVRGTDPADLIEQAKKLSGGKAPAGVDVVYTMTAKDLVGPFPHGKNVAGLVDCVGGVRSARHAFAVGETFPVTTRGSIVPGVVREPTGKTLAHEVGHLLGAHHHYASTETAAAADPHVFTLMGPSLSIISLTFSTLNTAVVRGHMELSR